MRSSSASARRSSTDEVFVGTGESTPRSDAQPGSSLGGVGIFVASGPATGIADDPWTLEARNLVGRGVYRLAGEPGGAGVVAATSIGLFERPAGGGAGVDWTRVGGTPFSSLQAACTDVLWTPEHAPSVSSRAALGLGQGRRARRPLGPRDGRDELPARRYRQGEQAEARRPGGSDAARSRLPLQRPAFRRQHEGQETRSVPDRRRRRGSPDCDEVTDGVPDVLDNQGFYDLAIAVDPADANRVVLGGAAFYAKNPAGKQYKEDDGAIFSANVAVTGGKLTFGHPSPPTMIGVGAHADVHDLQFSNSGARLFAATDGGVFRSDHPRKQVGFVACNDGLAVIEANFVASHPTCEGHVVVGLQDNGILEGGSTGVWQHTGDGDAGGVAFDPVRPERYFRQFHDGRWTASNGSTGFHKLLRLRQTPTPPITDDGKNERDAAAFYSLPAAIKHTRGATDFTQIVLGTDRVWYTDDWGARWWTLPSGSDPIGATTYNRKQDRLREAITVCRWAGAEVAWILGEGILVRLARTAGTAPAGGGPGTWTSETLLETGRKNKKQGSSGAGALLEARTWTDIAVNFDAGAAQRGPKGALYLGTAGHPTNAAVDTLWWFDGTNAWHPTGLRAEAVAAPVTAVLCDPANPDLVYVGTTVGVWRGTRTFPGGAGSAPDWAWLALVNGLPEAAVEDLSLFDSGGMRLLRAAIASRGVWELDLVNDVEDLTYLRAHDDDLRRRPRALDRRRNGTTLRSWHGSPDVRPRLRPSDVPLTPPAAGSPWTQGTVGPAETETLRRFQAALRSQKTDPRSRPTGVWDLYFEEVLRDHSAPVVGGECQITAGFFGSVMTGTHANAEPWGSGTPSEADLYEFTQPLSEGSANRASCALPAGRMRVDVVVHHRGEIAFDGDDARVTLLHWIDDRPAASRAKHDDAGTWVPGNVPWTGAVNDVLNSAGGTTSRTFAGGWHFTESGTNRRRTLAGQLLEPAQAGIVTFDIDLRGARQNLLVVLVAVIRAGANVALAAAPLRDLALDNPNVAVRSMRVNPT